MFNDSPLSIECLGGKSANTQVVRLIGPLTLTNLFDFQQEVRRQPATSLTVFDLSGVPYMDSAGMGAIVNHYVHCEKNGARMIVTGVNGRVMELFKLTRVDTVIPFAASVEEADA